MVERFQRGVALMQRPETRPVSAIDLCRFTSVISTAWTLTAAGAHLMELPAKMRYEAPLYVRLHRTLYPNFGRIAGAAEAIAAASTAALAWWVRCRQPAVSRSAVTAAACVAAAHGVFWGVVQPVNVEMVKWPLDAIPADWANQRNRWEYGHAARAGLVTVALGALMWSILKDNADGRTASTRRSPQDARGDMARQL